MILADDHEGLLIKRLHEVELRLVELEAEREIRDLLAEYCLLADSFNWTAWQDLLSPDIHFDGPFGEVVGSRKVVAASSAATGSNDETQHLLSNIKVAILGPAEAEASAELIYVGVPSSTTPGTYLTLGGRYTFRFARDLDRWRISRVQMNSLYRREAAAVEGHA